jgi:hypothetical protein
LRYLGVLHQSARDRATAAWTLQIFGFAWTIQSGRRVIALDPATVEVLKAQAARQGDERKNWDEGWVETGLVFTAENGEALDPESVSRYFRQAVKKAMLPTIRLHDLRHTHATLALQAGIHPKVVSERLGHATVSITLDCTGCGAQSDHCGACHVGILSGHDAPCSRFSNRRGSPDPCASRQWDSEDLILVTSRGFDCRGGLGDIASARRVSTPGRAGARWASDIAVQPMGTAQATLAPSHDLGRVSGGRVK